MDAGCAGLGACPPFTVRVATHIRDVRDRCGCFAVRAGAVLGTSVEQIDRTYGHLLPDSIDRARVALDVFVSGSCPAEEAENGG